MYVLALRRARTRAVYAACVLASLWLEKGPMGGALYFGLKLVCSDVTGILQCFTTPSGLMGILICNGYTRLLNNFLTLAGNEARITGGWITVLVGDLILTNCVLKHCMTGNFQRC